MTRAEFARDARRLGLKKYRVASKSRPSWCSGIQPKAGGYYIDLHAKTGASAWSKFVAIYFGAMKPSRKDWTVKEIKTR